MKSRRGSTFSPITLRPGDSILVKIVSKHTLYANPLDKVHFSVNGKGLVAFPAGAYAKGFVDIPAKSNSCKEPRRTGAVHTTIISDNVAMRPITPLLPFCLALAAAASAAEIHVSPTGDDRSPGSTSAPVRTLGRARDLARAARSAKPDEPVRVLLGNGVYEQDAPLEFGPQDSGTATAPVSYEAAPGASPVISGGKRITGWRVGADGRWRVIIPEVKSGAWFFRQLTVGGTRATRARWPNEDGPLRIKSVDPSLTRITFNQPLPKGVVPGPDTELFLIHEWSISRSRVERVSADGVTTAAAAGYLGHAYTSAAPNRPGFLEHACEFLDAPREWFLDRTTGELTYIPAPGETPLNTPVIAPRLEQLFRIDGKPDAPARHLRFSGIQFCHTRMDLPPEGFAEIQAAHYSPSKKSPVSFPPTAMPVVYAENIIFERCRFANHGASGLAFGAGCRDNLVTRCTIEEIGLNGLMIGWRGVSLGKPTPTGELGADWRNPGETPARNTVSNCVIRRCAQEAYGSVGIYVAISADTQIANNLVHDLPYSGISAGFKWNSVPSSQVRCLIVKNHIFDVMKKVADGGGVYTLGFQPDTLIRGNHIHAIRRSPFVPSASPNNGFFLDEGSKGFRFEDNVVYDASGGPVRFNFGKREFHTWGTNWFGPDKPVDPAALRIMAESGPK